MELRVSSQKRRLSSSDYTSDPEDKEISEDEDDDRNHKHRKRDTHSQSLEGDSPSHVVTRPNNKRNKPFVNGHSYRDGDQQSGRGWNNNGNNVSGRDFQSRFDKRRLNQPNFSRGPVDMNQRFRNQPMPVANGPVRNRGMDFWSPHDPRLGVVDVVPQMVPPRPIPGGHFTGRGMPHVSSAFGLIQGLPNGGLDALPPLGFQGPICPPMNLAIPPQRCRDFEERGFCLRGDMCPMEHGLNRIVVEDVQSLSQFNLPGSQLLGTSGQGSLPIPVSLLNNEAFDAKPNNRVMPGDALGLNGDTGDDYLGGGPDVYDPDQPLWGNDKPETSAALLACNQSNVDEMESLPDNDMDPSDQLNTGPFEECDDDHSLRTSVTSVSQSSSMWGRVGGSKHRSGLKGKHNSIGTSSSYLEQDVKSEEALQTSLTGVPNQGPWTSGDKSVKPNSDVVPNSLKPSDRVRTLFVRGIPVKENRKENLLSHFQKFGQVVDIYIPVHTDLAFVQFLKREEAEAALKAPDAVMGNRFIRLFWGRRDNISHETTRNTSTAPITSSASTLNPALSHPSIPNKHKENPAVGMDGNARGFVAQVQVNDNHASMVANGPQTPPVQQKKLENLERLKEIRKMQESLAQKRNEFKSQLDKFQKQTASSKDVPASDQTTRGLKAETSMEHTKAETSKPSPKTAKQEPLRPLTRAPPGAPFVVNRFKLDNRPTAFRILSPIPAGLANVAALEEYFSPFGDLSSVELEDSELQDDVAEPSNISARIYFKTRRSAEKAFLHGKSWDGHNLQFKWLSSMNSVKDGVSVNPAASNLSIARAEAPSPQSPKVATLNPENQTREIEVKSIEPDKDSKSVSS